MSGLVALFGAGNSPYTEFGAFGGISWDIYQAAAVTGRLRLHLQQLCRAAVLHSLNNSVRSQSLLSARAGARVIEKHNFRALINHL